ncbi:MAG: NAD-dependent epimerase/dehydratase family protein, partial [Bacteroidetes bacterium]
MVVGVLGASGYVGGRLVAHLLARGHRVRALGRSLEKLRCRSFAADPSLELRRADALDPEGLERALQGCSTVVSLLRSPGSGLTRTAPLDLQAARHLAQAAERAGVTRLIHLSGPGPEQGSCFGSTLKNGPVPLIWLKAGIILAAGSAWFEIIRHLAERLPVLIAPRWMRTRSRPIAIRDVLSALTACVEEETSRGLTAD